MKVSVFASGLDNPRGLKFGPDGYLYVAEGGSPTGVVTEAPAGLGGDCSAGGTGPGDYYGSTTGSRISRIENGVATTFVDNLPSSEAGGLASGVADVAFIGNTMYAILAGAGCSHGVPSIPNGVIRINPDHSWTMIADLGAYQRTHPVANPTDPITGDFEPDGTWYGMIALRGDLYAIEPNHGEMVKITTNGEITRVIDISASLGHVVPTVVGDHGVFYVGNLGRFDPDQLNTQDVLQITPSRQLKVVATGLSKVLGLAFDGRNRLYVLETSYSTSSPGPVPATGRLIRILPNGQQQVLIDSTLDDPLFFPTGITFGPDGALYISNFGFGPPDGQILKVEIKD
ncbi:MAG TPA: ScyD/ScyE family protein [Acidimicrobiales bacterium]|nr:ScyD/ScyE family protein [Acidimicrobiales bacterium]